MKRSTTRHNMLQRFGICFVMLLATGCTKVPDEGLVWMDGVAHPLRCNMGACTWAWFIADDVVYEGPENETLRLVKYKAGHSKDYFISEDGLRRVRPSAHIEYGTGDDSEVTWRNDKIYEVTVFCSTDKPTVISDPEDIRPFGFPIVYGYELASVSIYFRICHQIDYNSGVFEELGYNHEEPADYHFLTYKHRQTKYDSLLDLRKQ